MTQHTKKTKVGISIGDINGIGMEVILKSLQDQRLLDHCIPIIYGSTKVASYYRKALDIQDFSFNLINQAEEANPKRANIINCWNEDVKIEPGTSTETAGKYALLSLEKATADLKAKKIDALVTAPINKNNMQQPGFTFAGHTEYLQHASESNDCLMMLVSENLRIGVVTGHIPVKDVAAAISIEKIVSKLQIMNQSLKKDFWIEKPKIAILGLNPHAGDEGVIGNEEQEVIIPAIQKAKDLNITAMGPYAADGFFGNGSYKNFDAVLAMYHDQGLIPFKNISFNHGVNFTAGLPFVRTSPDHGTAYDIVGKNIASESSFREAMYLACDIINRRREEEELLSNPLKIRKLSKDRD